MVKNKNKTDEKINIMCSKLYEITTRQNEQIFALTEQMNIMSEKMVENIRIMNDQSNKMANLENRLDEIEKRKESNVECQSKGSKKISKSDINEMSSDPNLDLIEIKEKQAHERFIKYQKENPQHDQNEWEEGPSLRKATPKVKSRAEKQRINYLETRTKITKDVTIEMAERIMAGFSKCDRESKNTLL
jgi:hypothetical protein